jgi:5-methylthioadenosine/S-adenosylhomocysteine deaminase
MALIYSASRVWPGADSIPIADGAVVVEGELISAIGQRSLLAKQFPQAQVSDFPAALIVPGLVNTHSHLELTVMRGFLDNEENNFIAWLKKLTLARLERMTAEDLYVSATWGAVEAARAGITCVGDASSAAAASMKALRAVGLRAIVFQESFGPDPRLAAENLAALEEQVSQLRCFEDSRVQAGVSPHAPYTVSAQQLQLIAEFALRERLPLMMHAAESEAEDQFMRLGIGLFAAGLRERGIEFQPPATSAIRYLQANGILQTEPLLAHCVRVDEADIEILANTHTRVAHCPKSNAKLGHGRAPLGQLLAAGVTVGLGTDSVASNNTADLIEEARFATLLARTDGNQQLRESFNAPLALKLATTSGARALGLEGKTGELKPGLQADFAVISQAGVHQLPSYDPLGTMLFASSGCDVILTVVAGKEIFSQGRITTVDETELRQRLQKIRDKLLD